MSGLSWPRAVGVLVLSAIVATFVQNLYQPASAADAPVLRVEITAKKFEFGAKEIRVKRGQRVTIVLRSLDFVHGFHLPDFNVRADGIPGKSVEITFVADKAGKFIYLCDNFCGDRHDQMSGLLIVSESLG